MPYQDYFQIADDVIVHLDAVVKSINDPFISSRYVGLVAISAVTTYELAIKDIFINFAEKKHRVFGNFTRSHFERINGRIKVRTIREDYITRFGDKYVRRFKVKLDQYEIQYLRQHSVSIKSSYGNIIAWRHAFVHQGQIQATYQEAVQSYKAGKEVIHCLFQTMQR